MPGPLELGLDPRLPSEACKVNVSVMKRERDREALGDRKSRGRRVLPISLKRKYSSSHLAEVNLQLLQKWLAKIHKVVQTLFYENLRYKNLFLWKFSQKSVFLMKFSLRSKTFAHPETEKVGEGESCLGLKRNFSPSHFCKNKRSTFAEMRNILQKHTQSLLNEKLNLFLWKLSQKSVLLVKFSLTSKTFAENVAAFFLFPHDFRIFVPTLVVHASTEIGCITSQLAGKCMFI